MPRVLIVDDSPSMLRLVSSTLEDAGHTVVQAADGVEALAALDDIDVDLVIADVNMPNMDGITLVGKLREREKTRLTPILMLTTETDAEKKKEAKRKGATGWLNKPFDEAKMLSTIKRVLE